MPRVHYMLHRELSSKLFGVTVLFRPESMQADSRGLYWEIYHEEDHGRLRMAVGNCPPFVQDDISVSNFGVWRGIHGDDRTWKLVSCVCGHLYAVVVNANKDSADYLKSMGVQLSPENSYQLLVPPRFGLGILATSDVAVFHYKQTTYYEGPERQFTMRWDDPKLNLWLPMKPRIVSERDSKAEFLP